ncbi:MAG TPA: single-stranded DNA-binding protein [Patescibacteria group bacterium]|nr:single-stranded DNA-binding protein [Patescibacteria group bacterium]
MDLNKVMIIGRLTRDPEVRTIPSGQQVATFSVATSRQWNDKASGEKKVQAEFHNVVAWRRLAEICGQYLKKGRQVYIEGYLQTRSWDDQSGTKRYRTEIVAENLIMLGSKGEEGNNGFAPTSTQPSAASSSNTSQTPPPPQPDGEEVISVEDIPF